MANTDMGKRWIGLLTLLYGLFLVYSSLVPFDFCTHAPSEPHGSFLGLHITEAGLPDVISNLAVYLPFGLLLRAFCGRRRLPPIAAAILTLLIVSAVSFMLEWLQTFLISRVSSVADWTCNILGAAVGVLLYTPKSALFRRIDDAIRLELSQDATALHVGFWGLMTVAVALVPLDLTLDASRVANAVRDAHFIPFARHARLTELARWDNVESFSVYHRAAVELWHLRIDYLVDVLLFLVLAVLIARRFRARGYTALSAASMATAGATAVAILTTGAGLFVMSVGCDVTRVLIRSVGGMIGAMVYGLALAPGMPWSKRVVADPGLAYRRALLTSLAVCLGYITARQLVPFHFTSDDSVAEPQRIEWLPFHMYMLAKLPQAALDLLHKCFRFITIGALAALLKLTRQERVGRWYPLVAGGRIAAFVAVLETLQYWLPGRVPAVTDVLIAWVLTALGVAAAAATQKHFSQMVAESKEGRADPALLNVELPPPRDDAPRKPRPLPADRAER